MATSNANVTAIKGDFLAKRADGTITMLSQGDKVHEGDKVLGLQWNDDDATLLLTLDDGSKEFVLHSDDSLMFDATLLGQGTPSDTEDATEISDKPTTGPEEVSSKDISDDTQIEPPRSEGISTSTFTAADGDPDNIIAHLLEHLKDPLMEDDIFDLTDAQSMTGIMDLPSAIEANDMPLTLSDADAALKSVDEEFLQSVLANTQDAQSTPGDERHDADDQAGLWTGEIDGHDAEEAHDGGQDTIFKIAFDEIDLDTMQEHATQESIKSLNIDDVLDLTPDQMTTLRISGDTTDTIELGKGDDIHSTTAWTKAAESLLGDDGNVYDVYTGISDADSVTLQIDQNIIVTDL